MIQSRRVVLSRGCSLLARMPSNVGGVEGDKSKEWDYSKGLPIITRIPKGQKESRKRKNAGSELFDEPSGTENFEKKERESGRLREEELGLKSKRPDKKQYLTPSLPLQGGEEQVQKTRTRAVQEGGVQEGCKRSTVKRLLSYTGRSDGTFEFSVDNLPRGDYDICQAIRADMRQRTSQERFEAGMTRVQTLYRVADNYLKMGKRKDTEEVYLKIYDMLCKLLSEEGM